MGELEQLKQELAAVRQELKVQKDLANATLTNALSTYTYDVTTGIMDQDIILNTHDGPVNLTALVGMSSPCNADELFSRLMEKTAHEQYARLAAVGFSCQYLKELEEKGIHETAHEYRKKENAPGPLYLRHVIHTYRDPASGHLIARGCVKDVSNRYNMNYNTGNLDAVKMISVNALKTVFDCVLQVEVELDSFSLVSASRAMMNDVGFSRCNRASELFQIVIDKYTKPEYQEVLRAFTDLNTLSGRMDGQAFLACEVQMLSGAWERAYFIPLVHFENGELRTAIFALMDISETKRRDEEANRRLQNALIREAEANNAKSRFLFNMSHDIRTPLNAIIGLSSMAQRDLKDEEKVRGYLRKVDNSSHLLLNILNDVLDMSRIESGKTEAKTIPCDLRRMIKVIGPTVSQLAAAKDMEINYITEDLQDAYVKLDYKHMERVLINLISNSVKYTQPGGKVDIIIEQAKKGPKDGWGTYRFIVRDNGQGMSEEFQKHMFEEFSREETQQNVSVRGTGLGLSITKSLANLMGGVIRCKSEPGQGTEMTVEIPLEICRQDELPSAEMNMMNARGEDTRPVEERLAGKKILLAEDNEINAEIAIDMLESAGIKVVHAADGREVLTKLEEHGPEYFDCILMDIQMPFLDGYGATKEILNRYPAFKAPIIALSANAFEEDRKKSMSYGMIDHVSKPIDRIKLFEAIAGAMKG